MFFRFFFSFVFFCGLASAQERPMIFVVDADSAPIGSFKQSFRRYWGDKIAVTPKSLDAAKTSAKQATRSAMSEARCDDFAVTGTCYVPYRGQASLSEMSATVADIKDTGDFKSVSLVPVARARQAPSQPLTNDPFLPRQWQIAGFPGSMNWKPFPGKADHAYYINLDTGGCFGHDGFEWKRNFWNFDGFQTDQLSPPLDLNGHGCSTAGVVLAKVNDGKGTAGFADFANFAFVKILDSKGYGDPEIMNRGILATAEKVRQLPKGARIVAQASWGFDEVVPSVEASLSVLMNVGVMVAAAIDDRGLDNDRIRSTPSTTPGVYAFGACASDASLAARTGVWVSGYGRDTILACAPGIEILAPVPYSSEGYIPPLSSLQGYKYVEGTSWAASHGSALLLNILAKFPDITDEQMRTRVKNGRFVVKPATITGRQVSGDDLFIGGLICFECAVADDTEPPARPQLKITPGSGSAEIEFQSTEEPFGHRCFSGDIGNRTVVEKIPSRTGSKIILANLPNDTLLQASCQIVDKAGNWSQTSPAVSFRTLKAEEEVLGLDNFTPGFGPMWNQVLRYFPNADQLWTKTDAFAVIRSGEAYYAGDPENLGYHGGNDSTLVSRPILVPREGTFRFGLNKFSQILGKAPIHTDEFKIVVSWIENGEEKEKVLTSLIPNNKRFGQEMYWTDLSWLVGKTNSVTITIEFFSNGSTTGFGAVVFNGVVSRDAGQ